jgi:hypothetical protein
MSAFAANAMSVDALLVTATSSAKLVSVSCDTTADVLTIASKMRVPIA